MTQAELAEKVDLEVMTISRIENGTQYPKPENLDKFSKILKTDLREFYDFGHLVKKQDLIDELCTVIKNSNVKDLQFYKKVICSYIESQR